MKKVEKGRGKLVKTSVREEEIILPGQTWLWQSNRVTESNMFITDKNSKAKYADLNIYHTRILATIMYKLQDAIHAYRNERDWKQLDIFRVAEGEIRNTVEIAFEVSLIASKQNYKHVENALTYLRHVDIKMKSPYKGDEYINHTGFLDSFDLPKSINKKRVVYIYIKKEVAEEIIKMRTLTEGGGEFTKYLYEVIMNCTNKYTWKVYQYISMWREAGGVRVSYDKFRQILGIEDHEYKKFSDFKARVLMAVQNDLYDVNDKENKKYKADCWYNCNHPGMVERKGKNVIYLNFKVITPTLKNSYESFYENQITKSCIALFGFKNSHVLALQKLFDTFIEPSLIMHKIEDLYRYIEVNRLTENDILNDTASYALKSILNEFKMK